MKTGAQLIAEERERQISLEGYTSAHDDKHGLGEIARAAVAYIKTSLYLVLGDNAAGAGVMGGFAFPWGAEWWKPSPDAARNLVKAGALIAAEIDRLNRAKLARERAATKDL